MASEKKSIFETKKGKTLLNYVYSGGAAVVIAGALFKIMHWPGANAMLIIGMGTEVLIFIISAFEPQFVDQHYNWENVYPQLLSESTVAPKVSSTSGSVTQQLDKLLSDAKVGPELIGSLGKGLSSLSDNVSKMSDLTDATVASNDFAKNAKAASGSITGFATAATTATQSLSGLQTASVALTETASEAVKFKEQLGALNKNLASLNTVYGNMLSAMRPQ
ncbi:MAG: gliding motility protein GldL [Chitinophagales bacterium]|nr:gliding motility protein GldL [Chitinophagales bacterium]